MAIQDQASLNPWAHMPYSYEAGSSFGGGQGQASGASLYAPDQQQQTAPTSAPPQTAAVPQYQFGGDQEGDDAGDRSAQFASSIGQGVLSASQAATKKKGGIGGMMGGGGGSTEGGAGLA